MVLITEIDKASQKVREKNAVEVICSKSRLRKLQVDKNEVPRIFILLDNFVLKARLFHAKPN